VSRNAANWLRHGGIGRRIAITMIVSLVAIQAQAFFQISNFSRPELHLTTVGWMTDTTARIYHAVYAAAPDQRIEVIAALEREFSVKLHWSVRRPWTANRVDGSGATGRLAATVKARLGNSPRIVEASLVSLDAQFPIDQLQVRISPADSESLLGTSTSGGVNPDEVLPPNLRISIQGPDGSWLWVAPIAFEIRGPLGHRPYIPLIVGGLIIALFSVWTARSIVRPLERLAIAAEHIGRSREFVPVAQRGLHEFAAVAQAFEDMQRRLLRLIDDRTQMLAAISHDLRSSLTRLRIVAESNGGQAALLRELDDMHAMLESTLTFARGDADRGPSQPTDVAALIISTVDDAVDAGWNASYEGPDHAEIDGIPVSLKRAFRNLLDNAVKYGHSAHVTLQDSESSIRVVIADQGPGIPADRVLEALTPFRRLDESRSGAIPGAGLGLPIAQDAIHTHGGTLALHDTATGGLVVEVTLPRRILGPSASQR
jgi:signal transduction histidine kinase